jgi:hypothetical protein
MRTHLPILLAAAAAVSPFALPRAEPQCCDVRDLVLWQRRAVPAGTLLDALAAHLPGGPELTLRSGFVLFSGSDVDAANVYTAIAAIRDETGRREVERAAAARRSLLHDYDDGHGAILLKATWTGTQTEPVPGLAVHGSRRIFSVVPFRAFRRRGIHYGNDDLPVFRSFTAGEQGLANALRAVLQHPVCEAAMTRTEARDWSLSIVDTGGPKRPNYVELLLTGDEGRAVFAAIAAALPDDAVAQDVLADLARF